MSENPTVVLTYEDASMSFLYAVFGPFATPAAARSWALAEAEQHNLHWRLCELFRPDQVGDEEG